ncbi:hypothetical protein BDZ89DRAFT_506596 [Hymenopellis radicata]|nr:hypothetical protein BDZ89DRAFT_506596 [Hymenopellis radicata]
MMARGCVFRTRRLCGYGAGSGRADCGSKTTTGRQEEDAHGDVRAVVRIRLGSWRTVWTSIDFPPPPPNALLFSNLSPFTSAAALRKYLSAYGVVKGVEARVDRETGGAWGVVRVLFGEGDVARKVWEGVSVSMPGNGPWKGTPDEIRQITPAMRATLGTGSDDVHVCFDGDGRRCEAVVKELERRKKAKTQAAVSAAPKAATPKVNGATPVQLKVNGGAGTPHGGTPRTLHPSLPSLPKPAHSLPKPPFPLPPKPGPVASTRDPSLAATPMRPVDEREADKEREREKMEILKRARQAVGGVVDDKEKEKEVEEGRRRGRLEGFKVRQTRVYDRRERERSRSRSRSRSRERRWDTYRGRGYRSRSRERRYGRHEGRGGIRHLRRRGWLVRMMSRRGSRRMGGIMFL